MHKITEFFVRLATFISEVGVELKKSAWPTRTELLESTVVVILSVIALGLFVGLSDFLLMKILKIIL